MAPKKKPKKGGQDDWEADLGETTPAPPPGSNNEPADGEDAVVRKNNEKRKKKGLDDDKDASPPADVDAATSTSPDLATKAAEEANMDDEFALPTKAKKSTKAAAASKADDDNESATGDHVLSKKEKERLKKEKEKARKKEQVVTKKKTAPAATKADNAKTDSPSVTPTSATASTPATAATSAADTPADGKKKKVPAHLALIQKQQRALREQQEAEAKRKADEAARIAEIERQEAEAAAAKAAEKLRKKQKEKEKMEQRKRDGTFLTEHQRKERARSELKLQQLIAAGLKVEGLQESDDIDKADGAASTSHVTKKAEAARRRPKPGGRKTQADEDKALAEAAERAAAAAAAAAEHEAAEKAAAAERATKEAEQAVTTGSGSGAGAGARALEDGLDDDWETAALKAEASADVPDSWDADSANGEEEGDACGAGEGNDGSRDSSRDKHNGSAKATHGSPSPASAARGGNAKQSAHAAKGKSESDSVACRSKTSLPRRPKVHKNGEASGADSASASYNDGGDDESVSDSDASDDEDDNDGDDGDGDVNEKAKRSTKDEASARRKVEAAKRRQQAHEAALAARSKDDLRSPICCILGHVDTGKTKLLDKIRQTNVQEGEAGGITQQIGATYFPVDTIRQKTAVINRDGSFVFKVPGLLVIDTPGHESFSNLRSRGSSLCNIAILVVDIMHGLEPQTLESLRLLRDRKTPFVVALNKIDRLYGWKKVDNNGFQESLELQNKGAQNEFRNRLEKAKLAFAEQGFNSEVFFNNSNMAKFVSLVPTSAHTGEGIPDLLKLLVQLTQERMTGSLMYLSEVQATVLEVKAIEGFGMTIDVILSNGIVREGDRIVICGTEGAIKTNIRALLTPAPLRELRVRSAYVHNKEVRAAMGVKISAPGLEGAIAGSRLLVVGPDDDESNLVDEVESDSLFYRTQKSDRGVSVQASTLGSLEALLDFLRDCKIPVARANIGPVYKRDVVQCCVMLEKAPDYAVMLCFDVKIDKEAQAYADENGIKIFTADIIYHLFDAFNKHQAELLAKKKEESKMLAVFPCVLSTVAVFNNTSPIVVGVDVMDGQLKLNTPIATVKTNGEGKKEIVALGRVTSIERDHKQINVCKKGQPSVAIKIESGSNQPAYGRHLEEKDQLFSHISRASIDCLKEFYRTDVTADEWSLLRKLKPVFDIP